MEQPRSMQELKQKTAFLEIKKTESEFFLRQEFESVIDSYSPAGILDAVLENKKVSKKKWLILAIGVGLSAVLRKYVFKPREEPEQNFMQSLLDWIRGSNDDLIDKGMDYIRDWIKGNKN